MLFCNRVQVTLHLNSIEFILFVYAYFNLLLLDCGLVDLQCFLHLSYLIIFIVIIQISERLYEPTRPLLKVG